MNIFITSFDSKKAASHLDDLRLNKMILETAQLLSSAYRHLFGDDKGLYKDTRHNNNTIATYELYVIMNIRNHIEYLWRIIYHHQSASK